MLRSMFSAISGLRAHQEKLDVVGNNIANVNTVGYKSSSTIFEDTLSQMLSNGSAATSTTGGTNPAQVGLGVKVAGVTTNWGQGSAQSTGRSTDFMITGDGFFATKSGNETLYTRAGSMNVDSQNRLVTTDGAIVQGWKATNGVVDSSGSLADLTIPYGKVSAPAISTTGGFTGNLSSAAAADATSTTQSKITLYDKLGKATDVTATYTKSGDNEWSAAYTDPDGNSVGSATISFNTDGSIDDGSSVTLTLPDGDVTLDQSGMTQYATTSSVKSGSTDGHAAGTLTGFTLSGDGTIVGTYSNGLKEDIGQVALATFSNPNGLEKAGGSSFRVGNNSGAAQISAPGTGGAGTLTAGSLEMSNVDLSQEFTDLIIAQRGFQANSKVITTSDEILQSLVQMKQ